MADIKPPFTAETARKKVKAAQDLWNTQYVTSKETNAE
jgi:nuclear transport factor 2 (NTF2) superfamily protein